MRRIIGIGNRYVAADAAGPRVCDYLLAGPLPAGVEVVDGGLAGLGLLRFVEGAEAVVFIDAVQGFVAEGEVVVLAPEDVIASAPARHDHGAGLPYLLRLLPRVLDGEVPPIRVVGIEGEPDEDAIARAAAAALAAVGEMG